MSLDKAIQTCEEDIFECGIEVPVCSPSPALPLLNTYSDKEKEDLITSIYDLIEEYLNEEVLKMSKPEFMVELIDNVAHVLFQQLTDAGIYCNEEYDPLHDFVDEQCHEWFANRVQLYCPMRCIPHHCNNILECEYGQDEEFTRQYITDKLKIVDIKNAENPQQRTPEWYKHRYNMLTASNLWQALNTEAQRNRLIYEKCKPLETPATDATATESKWISTEGSLHWGVRYEPLTVLIYERLTGARVGFYGCITHSEYPFLGASPDGIVVNQESPLYGRLVEIKNIFNRDMDGTPSEAYWIQMQIQMQCCDLDACDFVETRFKEYETPELFWHEDDPTRQRGIILQFIPRDGLSNIPVYKYMPLDLPLTSFYLWLEEMKTEVTETYILFMTHYWYLDEICMTVVLKNDAWFRSAMPVIKETWDTILKERVSGFEHRASKKRAPKEVIVLDSAAKSKKICLIKLTEEESAQEY
jgi:putative phage-type endonuclease